MRDLTNSQSLKETQMKASKKTNAQMGLEERSFPKNKKWMVDQDYTKTLSPEEQDWLGRFNQEYYRNRFESSEKDLHSTPEQKRQCYGAENARNRDLYSIKNVGGMIEGFATDEDGNDIDTIGEYEMGYAMVDYVQEQSVKSKKSKSR